MILERISKLTENPKYHAINGAVTAKEFAVQENITTLQGKM